MSNEEVWPNTPAQWELQAGVSVKKGQALIFDEDGTFIKRNGAPSELVAAYAEESAGPFSQPTKIWVMFDRS